MTETERAAFALLDKCAAAVAQVATENGKTDVKVDAGQYGPVVTFKDGPTVVYAVCMVDTRYSDGESKRVARKLLSLRGATA